MHPTTKAILQRVQREQVAPKLDPADRVMRYVNQFVPRACQPEAEKALAELIVDIQMEAK